MLIQKTLLLLKALKQCVTSQTLKYLVHCLNIERKESRRLGRPYSTWGPVYAVPKENSKYLDFSYAHWQTPKQGNKFSRLD